MTLGDIPYYLYFTDGETEAQKDEETHPRSHRKKFTSGLTAQRSFWDHPQHGLPRLDPRLLNDLNSPHRLPREEGAYFLDLEDGTWGNRQLWVPGGAGIGLEFPGS